MKKSEKIYARLKKNRLIALLTPKSAEGCVKAYELLSPFGITLEIAIRSEYAISGLSAICDKYPDSLVLAGTVLTRKQAQDAISAGAAGIVSADFIPEVVEVCVEDDIMCIPGGLSDAGKQLVLKAEGYECSLEDLRQIYPYQWVYKLFPAYSGNLSQMDLASSWQGPFKGLTVIYAGGITLDTLSDAVRKDPEGIFCASALTKNIGEPDELKEDVERWKAAIDPKSFRALRTSQEKTVAPIDGPAPKVVTFGEMLMRLSPPHGIRLQNARNFELNFGGAEANVAVLLAQFGLHSFFITVIPKSDLGDSALGTLKMHGVDTRFITREGERMGIYYLERGSGPRPSKVIYDRAHSSFSAIKRGDFDWERTLENAKWFHWTGITPALGDSVAACLREALGVAKDKGITVSVDLNYRKKLWSEAKAKEVMTGLMPFVDILIGNEEDPIRIFGMRPKGSDVSAGKINIEGYQILADELVQRFGFKKVCITLRESISASENIWSACLFDGKNFYRSPKYHVWITDRVGAGDAFAAGLIYSHLKGKEDPEALRFGVAAACLKHSIRGDFTLASVEEVDRLAAGEKSGRVQR